MPGTKPMMAYWGQHKCGSNWIHQVMGAVSRKLKLSYARFTRPTDFEGNLGKYVKDNKITCVAWVNADYHLLNGLPFRGFHVVRDPRDILVSGYFSHLKTHPTENWPRLAEFRPRLQKASKEDGIMMEFEFMRDVFRRFRDWDVNDPRTKNFRLEDISDDYIPNFREAFEFIGLFDAGLDESGFMEIMDTYSYEKMSGGRKKGQENTDSHYRKGVHGDWKNHLTQSHVNYIKENLNDILVKYGYEDGDNW